MRYIGQLLRAGALLVCGWLGSAVIGQAAFAQAAGDSDPANEPIQVFYYNDPPLATVHPDSGEPAGALVDRVRAVFATAKTPVELITAPLPRVLRAVNRGPRRCGFSFVRTLEREAAYHWIGRVQQGGWGFFARPDTAGATAEPTDIETLKAEQVIVQNGRLMISELNEAGFNVKATSSTQLALKALYAKRTNYIFGGLNSIPAMADMMNYPQPILVHKWRLLDYYLLCSRDMNESVVLKLRTAMQSIVAE